MAKHKGGHHGGAWKVAYADFVTAMMALFMVLWLVSQDNKIKEAVERAFRNPFSAVNKESTGIIPNPSKDAAASPQSSSQKGNFQTVSAMEMEMLRRITEDLSKMLQQEEDAENSVQMDLTPDGLRISVFDRTRKPIFEPDTDVLTRYGDWVFGTLAWEIARYQTFRIELEGHTSAVAKDSRESQGKWELSAERANAARRKLGQSGVLAAQFSKVSGFADTVPMPSLPPTAEVNRRVTVLLKGKSPDAASQTAANP